MLTIGRRPPALEAVSDVTAVLSADCNLRCAYCYQEAKRPGVLDWAALRAALDVLLAPGHSPIGLGFSGGEPVLAFPLIRQAVHYILATNDARRPVTFHLVTNGLLLGPDETRFLAEHDVKVDLSFDGVPEAQDLRAKGTFAALDRLLDHLRDKHPRWFADNLTACITVTRNAVRHLGDSFAYFLTKQVRTVTALAAFGEREWSEEDLQDLDAQFTRIVDIAIAHRAEQGAVPFAPFREQKRRPHARAWACAAPLGRRIAIDVDGRAYPCAVLAPSFQSFAGQAGERVARLSLGDVRDREFADRLAGLPDACRESGMFAPIHEQHSAGRQCASCRERAHCLVCPLVRIKRPPPGDINEVPRYLCAYQRIVGRHRRRFLARSRPSPAERLVAEVLSIR